MRIRPRNIPMFLLGGEVPLWYIDRYGNRTALLDWDLNRRYDHSNENLNTNDHRNAGNLNTVYRKNQVYTGTPEAVGQDIQSFYDSDGNGMSIEDFVNYYNKQALTIRDHWAQDLRYNTPTAGKHNRLYRKMFKNRSNTSLSPGSDYNIGYLEDLEDIEGSSTWLRRMDLYENEFDSKNPDSNRLHEITLKDGTRATVYKKANGDIGIYKPTETPVEKDEEDGSRIDEGLDDDDKKKNPWLKNFMSNLQKAAPSILEATRLGMLLNTNRKILDERLAGITPKLQSSYHTYALVKGDEATKQSYYRRAAEGETRAAKPVTSDMDRQMAYMMEAKRIGDEARALGDLADNAEIRRTSEISNEHDWANTERDNKVANYNRLAMIDADKLRHDLKAEYLAANNTSWNNYLLGNETRMREKLATIDARNEARMREKLATIDARNEALNDEIFSLLKLQQMADDSEIKEAQLKLADALEKTKNSDGTYNINHPDVKKALEEWNAIQRRKRIKMLQERMNPSYGLFAKHGTKITYSDDLLYKTARDAVKHFREMTKMTDDSTHKSRRRPVKLNSYPRKSTTRKMLTGGVAPFGVFTPAAVGGQRASYSDTGSTKASKKEEKNDVLDTIKELFKNVNGLPSDVNAVFKQFNNLLTYSQAFGTELSSDDLASMYLLSMLQLNNVKYSKEAFDKAKELATNNDALNEYAVASNGKFVVQTQDGKLSYATLLQISLNSDLNPITNELLLNLRAYSPELTFGTGDQYMQIVNNGVGMKKIGETLKSLLPSIGSSEKVIEGYTKKDSNDIKAGLQALAEAPDGDYKRSITTKEQQIQAEKALQYLKSILPKNMISIIGINAYERGTSFNGVLASLVSSGLSTTYKEEYTAVTGKASDKGDSDESGKMTPGAILSMGLGEREDFVIADKTSDGIHIKATSLPILDANNHPRGAATLLQVGNGSYAGSLKLDSATMGGVKISSTGVNNILVTDRVRVAELPVDEQALAKGIIRPNLDFLKNIEKAEQQIAAAGITSRDNLSPKQIDTINRIYTENNLPMIYSKDANGNAVLTSKYKRFAMFNGTATKSAFEGDLNFNDGVTEVEKDSAKRFEEMMKEVTNDKKYSADIGWWNTGIYSGIVYVPMTSGVVSALSSTGFKASALEWNLIEAADLQAEFIRNKGLLIQGSINK